jgi:GNAT superfamily N-acetyltransferase
MEINIRKGYKEDLPAVLLLVQELATFEKEPEAVVVTLEDMENDGFGEKPVFKFIVAEDQGVIVGMALYYVKYSTWKGKCLFLEDLIVTQKYRRHKIGNRLFEEVIRAAQKMKARRMEWQVLGWNEPAIQFYKNYNAEFLKEWMSCRLNEEQIMEF